MGLPNGFTLWGKLFPCRNLTKVLTLFTLNPIKSLKNLVLRLKKESVLSAVNVGLASWESVVLNPSVLMGM